MNTFATIPQAIEELKKGKMLVVLDNAKRENQADVIFPAETATTEKINFLIKECGGMICAPMTKSRAVELELPLMVPQEENTEKFGCSFTVTVDARGIKDFGISAEDRCLTIKRIANLSSQPGDFIRPGHVFPIVAKTGGILERNGHTEAVIELAELSGFGSTGVLCEILDKHGKIMRLPELTRFARKFDLQMICIDDLIVYRKKFPRLHELKSPSVIQKASAYLPTAYGGFQIRVYKTVLDNYEHIALVMGNVEGDEPIITRIHSRCLTGDTFHSLKCDCGEQLSKSMKIISGHKKGVLLYLNQEGRGIGLINKIKAYALQQKGFDTVESNNRLGFPADSRSYEVAAEILKDLKIRKIILLTNNPQKVKGLKKHDIDVAGTIGLETIPQKYNKEYLATKKTKLGHLLTKV